MLQHFLRVEVCYQEGDIIAGDRFSSQDEEGLGSLGQETGKLVHEDGFDLIGLLDLDADADRVDAGLNQHPLVLVTRNDKGRQDDLGRRLGFDLGDVVPLGGLRGEVGQGQGGSQAASHALEVRPQ